MMRWLCVLALMGLAATAPLHAQQGVDKAMTYDVTSVKPNKTGSGGVDIENNRELYQAVNVSLTILLQHAYGLLSPDQVVGLPLWAGSARFDVTAKSSAEDLVKRKKQSRDDEELQDEVLMQALLADRFGMKVHHETRELPVFALVVAKGGLKAPAATAGNEQNGSFSVHNQEMTATGVPMSGLAYHLSPRVHKVIVDRTGLTGQYDFNMKWRRDDLVPGQDGSTVELPTLFDALQEQLGLKLEATKAPVDVVVVDQVKPPGEN